MYNKDYFNNFISRFDYIATKWRWLAGMSNKGILLGLKG